MRSLTSVYAAVALAIGAFMMQGSASSSPVPTDEISSPCTEGSDGGDLAFDAVNDPGTLYAIIMNARPLFSDLIDPWALANSIHYLLVQGNVWPMWICQYADGTVVYNKFRWYRDAAAVTNYFIGNPGEHDCDAYYYWSGMKYTWCSQNAPAFARQHGGIVNIQSIE